MQLNITEIRVRVLENNETKLKAIASITIDECFVIHDVKIIQGETNCFIAMPSRKTKEGTFKDIAHPIKSEVRDELNKLVIEAYEAECDKSVKICEVEEDKDVEDYKSNYRIEL